MGLRLIVLVSALFSATTTSPAAPRDSSASVGELAKGNLAFALDLYGRLSRASAGNLFFSPGCIHMALGMAYAGTRASTAEQMAMVLHFTLPGPELHAAFAELMRQLNDPPKIGDHPAYQLKVANALWGQAGLQIRSEFQALLSAHYGSGLTPVDFRGAPDSARSIINDWVEKQTSGKIKNLLSLGAITPETLLVLTSAVYFKSAWLYQFPAASLDHRDFWISPTASESVSMMSQIQRFKYHETPDLQALELPYVSGALSMVVLLPRKVDGLPALESALTPDALRDHLSKLGEERVHVFMPRFTFSSAFSLEQTLKDLGMGRAFCAGAPDFGGMTSAPAGLCLSDVVHKAYVFVDEKGTEAAAATALNYKSFSMAGKPDQLKLFKADHPFLFLIRHNATGEILFLGRVVNPKG